MALKNVITSQTGGREFIAPDFTKYSMFVGGTNATSHALRNYSPMMNGFGRLFMVRCPPVIAHMFAGSAANLYSPDSLFVQFKHMLEYMNRSVSGFGNKSLDPASTDIQGGFAGRKFRTPTVTKDNTDSFQVGLYELVGAPVMTVVDGWMNAIGDENSGLATYGGWISGGRNANDQEVRITKREGEGDEAWEFNEANHTCEFIYVMHDRSGAQVERAIMLADCYPTGIEQQNIFDMNDAGAHDNVTYNISFNCVPYRSPIITAIANDLLKQYRIVSNSLNFNPELGDAVYANGTTSLFSRSLGSIPSDSATGTDIGNTPVFMPSNTPITKVVGLGDMERAKLSGQPGYKNEENWTGFAAAEN